MSAEKHATGRIKAKGTKLIVGRYQMAASITSAGLEGSIIDQQATAQANARRLAACWNACDGISTENLEINVPVLELAQRYNTALKALKKAIAALETCTPGDTSTGHVIYPSFDEAACDAALDDWRAAISKATGDSK